MKRIGLFIAVVISVLASEVALAGPPLAARRSTSSLSLRVNLGYENSFLHRYASDWSEHVQIETAHGIVPSVDLSYRMSAVQFNVGVGYSYSSLSASVDDDAWYLGEPVLNNAVEETYGRFVVQASVDAVLPGNYVVRPGITFGGEVSFISTANGTAVLDGGWSKQYEVDATSPIYSVSGGVLLRVQHGRAEKTAFDIKILYRHYFSSLYRSADVEFSPHGLTGSVSYYLF